MTDIESNAKQLTVKKIDNGIGTVIFSYHGRSRGFYYGIDATAYV